jgi:type I restriction enzyme S subunit
MSWPTYALDELGIVSRGRSRHRPRDAQHLYGGPFPFVQTGDVKAAPLYLTSYSQTYSEAGLAQSKLWPAGTLCITIAANIAETCILGIDACFPDSIIGFVADPSKADTTFIKYQFDAVMREKMKRVSQGVAQDNLSQEKLLSFRFPVPDLPTQQRIAGILSAYDDLIENNRRRIGLLEQAARLLYREWFVHLRFPGHETAKIVEGLPEGWSRPRLGDVCSTNKNSHKAGKLPTRLRYIDIGSVSTGRIDHATEMTAEEAPGRARRIAEDGDTIWSNVRPNLRAYALVTAPRPEDVFSTGFTVLHAETVSPYFLYLAVTTDDFVKHLENHATGVGYPAVRADDFERALVIKPTDAVMAKFHELCQPIFSQRQQLFDQNAKLTRARDLLLPRLMDGRIPV